MLTLIVAMASCVVAKPINDDASAITLQCIQFTYRIDGAGIVHVKYCFDTKNALCYEWKDHDGLHPVDFKNCFDLYQEFIEPNEKAEKEP